MSETISSGLTITIPTIGEENWSSSIKDDCFTPISAHDHTGSGNGVQIATSAIATDAVTGTKILLANDQYLRGRNQANSADINILKVNTSDGVTITPATTISGAVTLSSTLNVTGAVTLTVPLAVAQGGTGSTSAGAARTALSAAGSGANSDITSMSACTSIVGTSLVVRAGGATDLGLGTNGADRWLVLAAGHLVPNASNTYDIGLSGGNSVRTVYTQNITATDLLTITGGPASDDHVIIQGAASAGSVILRTNAGSGGQFTISNATGLVNLNTTIQGGNSTKAPQTVAPDDWWEIVNNAGTSYFIPLYLAS